MLAEKAISAARETGCQHMCLDTIQGKMDHAIRMYRELGFREISPYYHNSVEGVLYMELAVRTLAGSHS